MSADFSVGRMASDTGAVTCVTSQTLAMGLARVAATGAVRRSADEVESGPGRPVSQACPG